MKNFLIVYDLAVFAVTAAFIIFGDYPRNPRFYITILALLLIGKVIGGFIDKHE